MYTFYDVSVEMCIKLKQKQLFLVLVVQVLLNALFIKDY